MTQFWTILSATGGPLVESCFATADPTVQPQASGCAWLPGYVAIAIPFQPDPARHAWTGAAWVESATLVEAVLIAQVKATNAAMVQTLYSTGFGKQKKYSRKQQEVNDWNALSATTASTPALVALFNALPVALQKQKFRYAVNDAAVRGDTIDKAIARFVTGIGVEDQVASWEAVEQKACSDIKTAATAAAKRAAYAAIIWTRAPS